MSRSWCGLSTRTPSSKISPLVGGSNPAIRLSNVDLPHPDGPTNTTNSLGCTVKVIFLSASTVFPPEGKAFDTSFNSSAPATPCCFPSLKRCLIRDLRQSLFLQYFVEQTQRINAVQFRLRPQKPNPVCRLRAFEQ